MRKHIPNALTILRFLMVPLFLYLMFLYRGSQGPMLSLIVFSLASLTDYVDGMLARKWNVISDFGKIMDPLADKLLVLSALLGLSLLPPWEINYLIFLIIQGGSRLKPSNAESLQHGVYYPASVPACGWAWRSGFGWWYSSH